MRAALSIQVSKKQQDFENVLRNGNFSFLFGSIHLGRTKI